LLITDQGLPDDTQQQLAAIVTVMSKI